MRNTGIWPSFSDLADVLYSTRNVKFPIFTHFQSSGNLGNSASSSSVKDLIVFTFMPPEPHLIIYSNFTENFSEPFVISLEVLLRCQLIK